MRRSPLLPIFLIVCVDVLGLTIILPLLPFYAEHLGATPTLVGLLISSYAFCQLIAGPLLGRMSDSVGRRPLLLVSQAGTFLGFLILANAQTLWVVFLARIIDGATAGNLSLAQAYISDVTEPENRAKSFAIIGIAFGLGFLVGPGVSGFLTQFGYSVPIYAAAGLSLTSIVCTYFLLPSSPKTAKHEERFTLLAWQTYAQYFRRRALASLLWQYFAFTLCFAAFFSGFALFAERRFTYNGHPFGAKEVGYVYAYVGLLGIILQGGFVGRLVKWLGETKLTRIGFAAMAIGFSTLGFIRSVPLLLIFTPLSVLGTGVLRPALTSLITREAGRDEQGTVLGLTQSIMSVAQIGAPFLSGLLIDHGFLTPWAIAVGVIGAVGLLL